MKILDKKNLFVEQGEKGEIYLTYDPNVNYDYTSVEDEMFVNTVTGDRIPYGELVVKVNDDMTDIYLYPLELASSAKAIKDYKIDKWVSIRDPRASDKNEDEMFSILNDMTSMVEDVLNIVKMISSSHPNLHNTINQFEKKYTNHKNRMKKVTRKETDNLKNKDNTPKKKSVHKNGFEVVK